MKKINTELPYFIDHQSINELIEKIDEVGEDSVISWNCFGGSVYAGQQFADYLNNCEKKLDANVSGIAASLGAALLPFFNKVTGAAQCDVMIHAASGGSGSNLRHTNEFLYNALAKKINEETFEKITGKKLKEVMMSEGDQRIDVWFTGKDAKKMGLFDEVYDLLDTKTNSLLPTNEIGYKIPTYILEKYNTNKKKDMEIKDVTAAQLQAENKEVYNAILAIGKNSEKERVAEIMNYAKYDIDKANEIIKSGENLKIKDVEHFVEKKFNAAKIESLEIGSTGAVSPAKLTVDKETDKKDEAFDAEIKAMRENSGINQYLKK